MEEEKPEYSVKEKEIRDLERLTLKFGGSSGFVDIQGDRVYGYIDNKRGYLGSLAEYSRYKNLKLKYKNKVKKDKNQENEENAYKCFLESCKSRNSRNT